ncbi:hypothetical protein O9929_02575 [Vibrio lentus]|nr:hypothetical protein [Vibrio lentus]
MSNEESDPALRVPVTWDKKRSVLWATIRQWLCCSKERLITDYFLVRSLLKSPTQLIDPLREKHVMSLANLSITRDECVL